MKNSTARAQGASTVSKRAAHTGKNCCEFTGHSSADGRAFLVDHLFPSFIGPSHQIEAVCVARAHKRKSIRLFFSLYQLASSGRNGLSSVAGHTKRTDGEKKESIGRRLSSERVCARVSNRNEAHQLITEKRRRRRQRRVVD